MSDNMITVIGNVADVPRRNRLAGGASVTNFRIAATRRRFDQRVGDFVDGSTLWLDVECWGEMAGHVVRSISKGDPVIVRGELRTDEWEGDAGKRSAPRLRASAVGPNLARGWAEFTKARRSDAAAGPAAADELQERSTDYESEGDGEGEGEESAFAASAELDAALAGALAMEQEAVPTLT